MAFAPVSSNISQAINFLTLPLTLTQSADLVAAVKSVLRSTLPTALAQCNGQATLSFSPTSLPPRPVLAACIACDLVWSDWMTLLGNRDFDLIIEAHDVLVTYFDLSRPYTITVWSEPIPTPATRPLLARLNTFEPQVAISKLGQKTQRRTSLKLQATVNSAIARNQTRTVAQQLLDENHKQEADEIFEMISKTCILSPTPTRDAFPTLVIPSLTTAFPSPLSSPEVSSPSDSSSSRPSSRSSISSSEVSSQIFVDTEKKDKTKYLYQGGYTTVASGGVMLGGGPKPSATQAKRADIPSVPKYRAPIGSRNRFPAATPKNDFVASAQSWRRQATPPRI
ncbi:hypothetical protein CPB83DRAFT_771982 [Crepidotus variabilis]|uniref:Uncharacterized protein n=1 Tax=Crepidotus variabilis TaxID=179855 RepID=A0A9P6EAX6_9AGAR|nr:hypothetical protein CPB83DRAFT_771982 [Crepidotus variabilis]